MTLDGTACLSDDACRSCGSAATVDDGVERIEVLEYERNGQQAVYNAWSGLDEGLDKDGSNVGRHGISYQISV